MSLKHCLCTAGRLYTAGDSDLLSTNSLQISFDSLTEYSMVRESSTIPYCRLNTAKLSAAN